jgi:hypothetical protein
MPSVQCSGTTKKGKRCLKRVKEGTHCHLHKKNIVVEETCECSICFETVDNDKHTTCCNHVFHKTCLQKWTINHSTCPLCRTRIVDKKPIEILRDMDTQSLRYASITTRYEVSRLFTLNLISCPELIDVVRQDFLNEIVTHETMGIIVI